MMAGLHRLAFGGALLGVLALAAGATAQDGSAPLDRPAPALDGGPWINSAPLTSEALRGRVVFVEFWTFG